MRGCGSELACKAALVPSIEVGAGCASLDEHDVDVRLSPVHVTEETSVAIDSVEIRVASKLNLRSDRKELPQDLSGLCPVALASALGRVDLDKPDAITVVEIDRVPVDDARHEERRRWRGR